MLRKLTNSTKPEKRRMHNVSKPCSQFLLVYLIFQSIFDPKVEHSKHLIKAFNPNIMRLGRINKHNQNCHLSKYPSHKIISNKGINTKIYGQAFNNHLVNVACTGYDSKFVSAVSESVTKSIPSLSS